MQKVLCLVQQCELDNYLFIRLIFYYEHKREVYLNFISIYGIKIKHWMKVFKKTSNKYLICYNNEDG